MRGRHPTPETAIPAHELPDDAAENAAEPERGKLRRCLVTRAHGERARMLRFVLGPDRQVVPDIAARLPGRGMWLSARADVIQTACAKGAFARAARGPVVVPADLGASVRVLLERRIADHLGLARRAGQAVAGFAKVRDWLAQGRVGGLLEAADGSEAERARLLGRSGQELWVAWPLSAAALGGIFGRDAAVHVAVARGRLAEALFTDIERLAGVTGQVMTNRAGE
jgi:predicted RNA-binding protein YlxR (DUF448 family)